LESNKGLVSGLGEICDQPPEPPPPSIPGVCSRANPLRPDQLLDAVCSDESVLQNGAHGHPENFAISTGLRTGFVSSPFEYGTHQNDAVSGTYDVKARDFLEWAAKQA
jgi:hypothetical protein